MSTTTRHRAPAPPSHDRGPGAPDRRARRRPTGSSSRGRPGRRRVVRRCVVMGLIGFFLLIGAWPALQQPGPGLPHPRPSGCPRPAPSASRRCSWGTILVGLFALAVAVPLGLRRRPVHQRVRAALAEDASGHAGRPDGRGARRSSTRSGRCSSCRATCSPSPSGSRSTSGPVLPFLRVDTPDSPSSYTSSAFIAGIAVGVVVLPTITSIMREVFSQAPIGEREGAIALGATRWGMIRTVVHPVRPGRHRRRHHARPRPGAGRDDRGLRDHLAELRLHHPPAAERHQHHRVPHRLALLRVRRARRCPACWVPASCCSCSRWSSTPSPASWSAGRAPAPRRRSDDRPSPSHAEPVDQPGCPLRDAARRTRAARGPPRRRRPRAGLPRRRRRRRRRSP